MPDTYEPWNLFDHGVTQSLLWQFLTCPQRLVYSQMNGLAPARISGALAFGSLIHEALDKIYKIHQITQANEQLSAFMIQDADVISVLAELERIDREKLVTQLADANAEENLIENYALAQVTLIEYFRHYQRDYDILKWVALESQFRVIFRTRTELAIPGALSIPVSGKFDGIFRSGELNKLYLFETKTKSRIEEDTLFDTLPYNLQVNLYLWAMRKLYGERPAGVLYNIIRKTALKRGVSETIYQFCTRVQADMQRRPDFYFIRYNIEILPEEQKVWYGDFKGMLASIYNWYEDYMRWSDSTNNSFGQPKLHYRNSTACSGAFGRCEFIPICARDERTNFVQKLQIFPELEAGAE